MVSKHPFHVVFIFIPLFALICCGPQRPEPQYGSSAEYVTYATEYPGEIQTLTMRLAERSEQAKKNMSAFSAYPDDLTKTNWKQVVSIYETAHDVGRSRDLASQNRKAYEVQAAVSENNGHIARRVSGAVKSKIEKTGCNCQVETTGTVKHVLNDSVDKELKKQLRERNEAHRVIERFRDIFSKKNINALEKHVDAITETSYIVHIELAELNARIADLVEEASDVESTIENAIFVERGFLIEPGITKTQKNRCQKQIEKLQTAKAALAAAVDEARIVTEHANEHIPAIRKDYDKAFEALCEKTEQKINE